MPMYIALRHGCSPVNLLHIFRTPFPRNTYGWLLLNSPLGAKLIISLEVSFFRYQNPTLSFQIRACIHYDNLVFSSPRVFKK